MILSGICFSIPGQLFAMRTNHTHHAATDADSRQPKRRTALFLIDSDLRLHHARCVPNSGVLGSWG